jgi:hypothetical protein
MAASGLAEWLRGLIMRIPNWVRSRNGTAVFNRTRRTNSIGYFSSVFGVLPNAMLFQRPVVADTTIMVQMEQMSIFETK